MQKLTNDIVGYLKYLNNTFSESVSLHFSYKTLSRIPSDIATHLIKFGSHISEYCVYVKSNVGRQEDCVLEQSLLYDLNDPTPRFKECHAGVLEYIMPICVRDKVVAFIAVAGHRKETTHKAVYNPSLWESTLSKGKFSPGLCDVLLSPLKRMLEELLLMNADAPQREINLIICYINELQGRTDLDGICRELGRSRSHISHLFKREVGCSVKEYCNRIRLARVKRMLKTTDFSVTHIAFECGFNDVSYLIKLFKMKYGISPLKYRKNKLSEKK